MTIDESLRSATVVSRDGYPYVIHPLTDGVPRADPQLLRAWVDWARGQPLLRDATLLVAPEAMALPLAAALALAVELPYVVVRKRHYGLPGETIAYAETGYGASALYVNDATPADRVVIIDDVVSTGGTLAGLVRTLREMDVPVLGALVFMDKDGGATRAASATGIGVAAMRQVRVDSDGVHVEPAARPS